MTGRMGKLQSNLVGRVSQLLFIVLTARAWGSGREQRGVYGDELQD